jgi:hypothetical protein
MPAKRSGDGALDRTLSAIQSGVALRLPPDSKTTDLLQGLTDLLAL